jgi:hypothetical protein
MDFLELQTYTRQRTNTQQNNTITDAELQTYLNMSLGTLYNVIATQYNDYNYTKYLATIGQSANTIPLPPDFFKLRAVDFGSPGAWVTIYIFGLQERNRFNNPIGNMFAPYGNQAARKVRAMGQQLVIEPENIASGQYQVWYTPKYQRLVLPTDTLIPAMDMNGWVEYAVASTGVKIYNTLNLPTEGFVEEVKYYEDMVRSGAQNRMSNGPRCVQNTRLIGDYCVSSFGGWGQ